MLGRHSQYHFHVLGSFRPSSLPKSRRLMGEGDDAWHQRSLSEGLDDIPVLGTTGAGRVTCPSLVGSIL